MERFKVIISVKTYLTNPPSPTMVAVTNYVCKNIVGGLSDLQTTLEFDQQACGFNYSYSNTVLRFCKEDKDYLLEKLFGQNYWIGGTLYQDKSYSIDYLPTIEIIDNQTNTTFIKAKLDIGTLKVVPPYIEVALIDNATIKTSIEKELSFSLSELRDAAIIRKLNTDDYQGNAISEHITMTAETFLDTSWGLNASKPKGGDPNNGNVSEPRYFGNEWYYSSDYGEPIAFPCSVLNFEGTGDLYANGEFWGMYGGCALLWTHPATDQYRLTSVSGFTLPQNMGDETEIEFNINFWLKRKRHISSSTSEAIKMFFPLQHLYLRMQIFDGNDTSLNTYQDILIGEIPMVNETINNDDHREDIEEFAWKNYKYKFNPNDFYPGHHVFGDFYIVSSNFIRASEMSYNFGTFYADCYVCDYQYRNAYNLQEYTSSGDRNRGNFVNSFSCKIDVDVQGIANSIKDKRNDLYGVPVLDFLQFIANKANVPIDYSGLTADGVNNIVYSNETFVNYEKKKVLSDGSENVEYMETKDTITLQEVIGWLDRQLFLSMYVLGGTLYLTTRRKFLIAQTGNILNVQPNRIIEFSVEMPNKTIKMGSKDYKVALYRPNEHFNMPATFELKTDTNGNNLDVECSICTSPQFIDWMLVASNITGSERCLIETYEKNGDLQLYAFATERIAPTKASGGYYGNEGLWTLEGWEYRHWLNVYLSPLAQFERWRLVNPPTPNNSKYKLIANESTHINIIHSESPLFNYQKINKNADGGTIGLWDNSIAVVANMSSTDFPTQLLAHDKSETTIVSSARMKIETPIYAELLGNVAAQSIRFSYNGVPIIGIPIEISTYFDRKVQEITLILLNAGFEINSIFE